MDKIRHHLLYPMFFSAEQKPTKHKNALKNIILYDGNTENEQHAGEKRRKIMRLADCPSLKNQKSAGKHVFLSLTERQPLNKKIRK